MGINSLTHRDDGYRVAVPVSTDDWQQWVSAGRTRNWMLEDPLIDWLQLYGKSRDYLLKQELAGYDKDLDFLEFIFDKGMRIRGRHTPAVSRSVRCGYGCPGLPGNQQPG